MEEDVVLVELDRRGIATVSLNRPEINNAYNDAVIAGLGAAFTRLGGDPAVRLVVLRGIGRHFQAGADLSFLRRLTTASAADNLAFSRATVAAISGLQNFPHPTLALVHGGCFGGGVGMVAACDMAVASEDAVFSLTETRWGITPAPVMPALIAAMGPRALGRTPSPASASGIRGAAPRARPCGLHAGRPRPGRRADHRGHPDGGARGDGGDQAPRPRMPWLGGLRRRLEALAVEGAQRRHSLEAVEGLASFAEKRPPRWYPGVKAL